MINPNDHVNLCQSTNDFYPSAAKLAVVLKHRPLMKELRALAKAGPGPYCSPLRWMPYN